MQILGIILEVQLNTYFKTHILRCMPNFTFILVLKMYFLKLTIKTIIQLHRNSNSSFFTATTCSRITLLNIRLILHLKFLKRNNLKVSKENGCSTYLFVYCSKLPRPISTIQERPMIKSIVIRTVTLCMIRRRQHCHLMTIDSVTSKAH